MAKIFYSWQADRPLKEGRYLVRDALADAISALNAEAEVEDAERDELELDSDTQGVGGSPRIVDTILRKIASATLMVADVTFVGERCSQRPTPNPNVAIEYGFALSAIGEERIVGVMNAAHGAPSRESLPFDLGHLRFPLTYNCPDDADNATLKAARKDLAGKLKLALRVTLVQAQAKAELKVPRPLHEPRVAVDGGALFRPVAEPIGMLYDGSLLHKQEVPVHVPAGPAMWLRLMPKFAIAEPLLNTRLYNALLQGGRLPRGLTEDVPLTTGVRGPDGFGMAGKFADDVLLLVYVFTSGEVWSIDRVNQTWAADRLIFHPKAFAAALADYARLLKGVGVDGPYRWVAGVQGIKGTRLSLDGRVDTFPRPPCLVDSVVREGGFSGVADEAAAAIEPFIAAVCDTGQVPRR